MSTSLQHKPRPHHDEPFDPILRPREVEALTGASWKTIARSRPECVIQLGKRAVAMRRSDVLRPASRPIR
jgi:hypothetical protein